MSVFSDSNRKTMGKKYTIYIPPTGKVQDRRTRSQWPSIFGCRVVNGFAFDNAPFYKTRNKSAANAIE